MVFLLLFLFHFVLWLYVGHKTQQTGLWKPLDWWSFPLIFHVTLTSFSCNRQWEQIWQWQGALCYSLKGAQLSRSVTTWRHPSCPQKASPDGTSRGPTATRPHRLSGTPSWVGNLGSGYPIHAHQIHGTLIVKADMSLFIFSFIPMFLLKKKEL